VRWLSLVILAEIRRITRQPREKVCKTLSQKRASEVTQVSRSRPEFKLQYHKKTKQNKNTSLFLQKLLLKVLSLLFHGKVKK
jgi:hypothetical protein